jgi:hypothetical protein
MGRLWMTAGLLGLAAGSAWGQALIPPSHMYSNVAPEPLDKNFGLPKVFTQEPGTRPSGPSAAGEDRPDPFARLPDMSQPSAQPSDTPDFFAKPAAEQGGVPNFFTPSPNAGLPKAAASQPGYATMDTPAFTTSEGMSTDDRPFDRPAALSGGATTDGMTSDTTDGGR